jgi:hypothetical protein
VQVEQQRFLEQVLFTLCAVRDESKLAGLLSKSEKNDTSLRHVTPCAHARSTYARTNPRRTFTAGPSPARSPASRVVASSRRPGEHGLEGPGSPEREARGLTGGPDGLRRGSSPRSRDKLAR